MNRREKILYHQIHPVKLGVDWICGLLSLIPFWNHQPVFGVILAFGPSLLTSYVIINYSDLGGYKNSNFGRYMAGHMSSWLQTIRLIGFVLMVVGAWQHDALIIAFGLALILLAWLSGIFATRLRNTLHDTHTSRPGIPTNLPR